MTKAERTLDYIEAYVHNISGDDWTMKLALLQLLERAKQAAERDETPAAGCAIAPPAPLTRKDITQRITDAEIDEILEELDSLAKDHNGKGWGAQEFGLPLYNNRLSLQKLRQVVSDWFSTRKDTDA